MQDTGQRTKSIRVEVEKEYVDMHNPKKKSSSSWRQQNVFALLWIFCLFTNFRWCHSSSWLNHRIAGDDFYSNAIRWAWEGDRKKTYLNKVLIGKCHPLANIGATRRRRFCREMQTETRPLDLKRPLDPEQKETF